MNTQCDHSAPSYADYLAASSLIAQSSSTSYQSICPVPHVRSRSTQPPSSSDIDDIIRTVFRLLTEAAHVSQSSRPTLLSDPSVGAFSELQQMEWSQTTSILDELSSQLSFDCSGRVFQRLRALLDNAREEDPDEPPVTVASLKDFGKFLKMRSDWIYPAIGISPRRNISIEWYKDNNHHLAIEFYGRGEVKFVIFAPDNARPNKTARIAGTASLDGIFEAIKSFNPLSWVANVER